MRCVPTEVGTSVPSRAPEFAATFRGARCQVPRSAALRGSGRLQGLAPLTSPLRRPAVSSGASPVSPMGLFPLRGPLVSAAVPRGSGAEALAFRWVPSVPKHGGFPGKPPPAGRPVRGGSVRSPQRVARGFRGIPSRVARDAPSRDCSRAWFRRAAPEVCPGSNQAYCIITNAGGCLIGLPYPGIASYVRVPYLPRPQRTGPKMSTCRTPYNS
jgi:hypothetical protein